MSFKFKIITFFLVLKILLISFLQAANSDEDFNTWLFSYKKFALKKGISHETIDVAFKNVKLRVNSRLKLLRK